jgi:hypothetical protein
MKPMQRQPDEAQPDTGITQDELTPGKGEQAREKRWL